VYSGWDDYSVRWEAKGVNEHVQQWENQVNIALNELEPVHLNSHSGSDTFTFPEMQEFFAKTLEISQRLGILDRSSG